MSAEKRKKLLRTKIKELRVAWEKQADLLDDAVISAATAHDDARRAMDAADQVEVVIDELEIEYGLSTEHS